MILQSYFLPLVSRYVWIPTTSTIYGTVENAFTHLSTHNKERALHTHNSASQYDCSRSLVHSDCPYGGNLDFGYVIEGAVTI